MIMSNELKAEFAKMEERFASIEAHIAEIEAINRARHIEQKFKEAENGIGSNVGYGNGPWGEL